MWISRSVIHSYFHFSMKSHIFQLCLQMEQALSLNCRTRVRQLTSIWLYLFSFFFFQSLVAGILRRCDDGNERPFRILCLNYEVPTDFQSQLQHNLALCYRRFLATVYMDLYLQLPSNECTSLQFNSISILGKTLTAPQTTPAISCYSLGS